jgi:hypothetical protein
LRPRGSSYPQDQPPAARTRASGQSEQLLDLRREFPAGRGILRLEGREGLLDPSQADIFPLWRSLAGNRKRWVFGLSEALSFFFLWGLLIACCYVFEGTQCLWRRREVRKERFGYLSGSSRPHSYDDISLLVSFVHVPMSFGGLLQRVTPINDGSYLACLE